MGNKFLTFLSNPLSDINLTDMETCYKVFKADIIKNIKIEENRFGFEPEVTGKIADIMRKKNIKIFEVGISYDGRTYDEGKKIGWKDGFSALRCILKYNTSNLAESLRYILTGTIVLLSQLLSMYLLVEYFGLNNKLNTANIVSTEIGFIIAFFLHRSITWNSKVTGFFNILIECIKFHIISIFNFGFRIILFYYLINYTQIHYLMVTTLSIIIVIMLNFILYRKLFNEKNK